MPKIKTNSSAAKRFKVTGSGKVKRNKAYKRHILSSKNKKQAQLAPCDNGGRGGAKKYSQTDSLSVAAGGTIVSDLEGVLTCREQKAGVNPGREEKKS